jgi:hypothetical protein
MSYRDWVDRGKKLAAADSNRRFEIGDWLTEGVEKWNRETYDEAAEIFSHYTRETLRNFASVARAVETSRRNDLLSWSHHAAVAKFGPEKQTALLAHGAEKGLSVAAFRDYIARPNSSPKPEPGGESEAEPEPASAEPNEPEPDDKGPDVQYVRIALRPDAGAALEILAGGHKRTVAEMASALIDQVLDLPETQREIEAFAEAEAA